MEYLQNLHTHSLYCDGKNSIEDMVKKAIELNFSAIGFSGHAPMRKDIINKYIMTAETLVLYKKEIAELKRKYKGIIDIYCGIEFDAFSECELSDLDYTIGSVHYIKKGAEFIDFDLDYKGTKKIVDEIYGGDGLKLAKDYYSELARLPEVISPDIVGHFDIITKHCEKHHLFDTNSKEYRNYALEALHSLSPVCKLFEVNTGAISRGYRLTPYPAPFILKEIKSLGLGVVITSDCHNKNYLNLGFKDALKLLEECGFDEVFEITENGFIGRKIK